MHLSIYGIMLAACRSGLMLGLACSASGVWANAELALKQGCPFLPREPAPGQGAALS